METEINGIVVGGRPRFRAKLKKHFPDFKFIRAKQVNFNVAIINKDTYVFFVTDYLSHAVYHKCMSQVKTCQAQARFIKQSNLQRAIKEINDCLGQ